MDNIRARPADAESKTSVSRHGVTMLELVAALALFSTVVMLVVPVLGRVAAIREETAAHETALREAANLMERLAALRTQRELTEADLQSLPLSEAAVDNLTAPQVTATLEETEGEPAARRLTVAVSWENGVGHRGTPATVTRYLYAVGPAR